MPVNIFSSHSKTDKPDVRQIFFSEVLPPFKRNIASLDDEVLPVLDGGFDHFAHNRPQVIRESIIIQRRERGVPAAYEPHFQMVDGDA